MESRIMSEIKSRAGLIIENRRLDPANPSVRFAALSEAASDIANEVSPVDQRQLYNALLGFAAGRRAIADELDAAKAA
jgi:hypothetical protein